MTRTLKDQAVIAGIGQTEFSKESGRSELQLCVEASLSAIQDAGLKPSDIDGLVTYTLDSNDEIAVMNNLGITEATYFSRVPFGGGATCGTIQRLLDCCQESDGGVAFVITTAERAKDLPRPAARIVAASSGATVDTSYIQSYYHDDLSTYPAFGVVARALWEGSGLGPDDMDA